MNYPVLALLVFATATTAVVFARLTGRFALAATAGGALILYLHGAVYYGYTSDDAYISYRYARHLGDGIGLVWNPGQYVEGYSNFLWVLLLAGLHAAGADIVWSGRWLGFAAGVATMGATYMLVRELLDRSDLARYAGLAAAFALAASGPFALWSYAGLETPLFALLVSMAVLLHLREQRIGTFPASGAVWALAARTRPDALVLVVVAAFFKLSDLILAESSEHTDERTHITRRTCAIWLGTFAVIFVPYFIWRFATYGWLFPNAYYAKVGGGFEQYERGIRYLAQFAQEYAAWLVLLAPVALLLRGCRRPGIAYVLALVAVWCVYVVYVGGDALLRFRFFAEILPLFYALIAASIAAIIGAVRIDSPRATTLRYVAGAMVATGLIAFTLQSTPNERFAVAVPFESAAVDDRVEIGRWLRANAPEDTSIAVLAAGAIPYESRLETIDMLGLNDEHIAHRPIRIGSSDAAAGHEKYDSAYVLSLHPDAIILFDGLAGGPAGRSEYESLSNSITPAFAEMVTTPQLWLDYEAQSVEIREGRWFNLLVRRGSPLTESVRSAAP